jgi:hypothetical protein
MLPNPRAPALQRMGKKRSLIFGAKAPGTTGFTTA